MRLKTARHALELLLAVYCVALLQRTNHYHYLVFCPW